jgi:hypothetical protein
MGRVKKAHSPTSCTACQPRRNRAHCGLEGLSKDGLRLRDGIRRGTLGTHFGHFGNSQRAVEEGFHVRVRWHR